LRFLILKRQQIKENNTGEKGKYTEAELEEMDNNRLNTIITSFINEDKAKAENTKNPPSNKAPKISKCNLCHKTFFHKIKHCCKKKPPCIVICPICGNKHPKNTPHKCCPNNNTSQEIEGQEAGRSELSTEQPPTEPISAPIFADQPPPVALPVETEIPPGSTEAEKTEKKEIIPPLSSTETPQEPEKTEEKETPEQKEETPEQEEEISIEQEETEIPEYILPREIREQGGEEIQETIVTSDTDFMRSKLEKNNLRLEKDAGYKIIFSKTENENENQTIWYWGYRIDENGEIVDEDGDKVIIDDNGKITYKDGKPVTKVLGWINKANLKIKVVEEEEEEEI